MNLEINSQNDILKRKINKEIATEDVKLKVEFEEQENVEQGIVILENLHHESEPNFFENNTESELKTEIKLWINVLLLILRVQF